MAAATPESSFSSASCSCWIKELTPPESWRTAARAARWPWAEISDITASARLKSMRPLRKARLVNSPGSAARTPRAYSAESTLCAAQEPPCR